MELIEGIIVKTIKYQDSSKIVYILTKEGLISALIRNCLNLKSKNYAYSKEAILIGFDFKKSQKNTFDIITSGKVINNLINIQNNYHKLVVGVEILCITYEYANFIEDKEKLYYFLKTTLFLLNDNDFKNENLYSFYVSIYKLKLLYLLGVGPNFKCSECGSNKIVYFDFESGSCKCHKHSAIKSLKEVIEVIKILYLGKSELFTEEILNSLSPFYSDVEKFINRFYDTFLHINKKNLKIFENLKKI